MAQSLELKICTKCFQPRPLDKFQKDVRYRGGLVHWCKKCLNRSRYISLKKNNPVKFAEKKRKAGAAYRKLHPDQNRANKLRSYFGMTIADYDALLKAQDGKCRICRTPPIKSRLCVDHCHVTGKVRGLLCRRCNSAIGLFQESAQIVREAAKYLSETEVILASR